MVFYIVFLDGIATLYGENLDVIVQLILIFYSSLLINQTFLVHIWSSPLNTDTLTETTSYFSSLLAHFKMDKSRSEPVIKVIHDFLTIAVLRTKTVFFIVSFMLTVYVFLI